MNDIAPDMRLEKMRMALWAAQPEETERLHDMAGEAHQTVLRMKTLLGMWQNEFGESDDNTKVAVLVNMLLDYANDGVSITSTMEKATKEPAKE